MKLCVNALELAIYQPCPHCEGEGELAVGYEKKRKTTGMFMSAETRDIDLSVKCKLCNGEGRVIRDDWDHGFFEFILGEGELETLDRFFKCTDPHATEQDMDTKKPKTKSAAPSVSANSSLGFTWSSSGE